MVNSNISFQHAPFAPDFLGETPIWSTEEQALYWIDCSEHTLFRWAEEVGARRWPMPERIGGVALTQGGVIVVLARGVHHFDPVHGKLVLIARSGLPAHISLHDCRCDREGQLWVGAIDSTFGPDNRHPGGGALMRLDGDRLTIVVPGFTVANGLAFSPDGGTLYATDTPTAKSAPGRLMHRAYCAFAGADFRHRGFEHGISRRRDGGCGWLLLGGDDVRRSPAPLPPGRGVGPGGGNRGESRHHALLRRVKSRHVVRDELPAYAVLPAGR